MLSPTLYVQSMPADILYDQCIGLGCPTAQGIYLAAAANSDRRDLCSMRKLRETLYFGTVFVGLTCLVMTATNLTLFAHLAVSHSHQKHDSDNHHQDKNPQPRQHDNCPTCQLLLGTGGKFVLQSPPAFNLTPSPGMLLCILGTQTIYQQNTTPFAVRGPPVV